MICRRVGRGNGVKQYLALALKISARRQRKSAPKSGPCRDIINIMLWGDTIAASCDKQRYSAAYFIARAIALSSRSPALSLGLLPPHRVIMLMRW